MRRDGTQGNRQGHRARGHATAAPTERSASPPTAGDATSRSGPSPLARPSAHCVTRWPTWSAGHGSRQPPVEPPPEPEPIPTFHQFAEEWWLRNEHRLAQKTREDYRWRLESHLLPYFKDHPLDAITFDLVERYIAGKLAEDKPLSPRSINMTVTLLAAILEGAVERELIARNPARGRGRRVRERAPRRSYLETAAQIKALLDAAGELDRGRIRRPAHRAARDARHADVRGSADRRALRAALARRGPRRRMAAHRLQDRRRVASREDTWSAPRRAARRPRAPAGGTQDAYVFPTARARG